ncbi:hypothetical protein BSLG_007242 [Batrachochytrium salamandrivorans]|nr:hypothetical protein BSLG_007242 [Batrachochytrium salamandrivorans]
MTLKLLSSTDELIAVLNDDEKMLGYYPVEDYMRLVVTDRNPHKGSDFSDVSKVQKLELDDKEYDKMRGTVREFKRMNKVGRFAEPKADDAAAAELASNEFQQEASTISVGDRFQVKLADGSSLQKRGVVMFVGKTDFKPGFWVGVEYDEPVGKHDGSMHGVSYFTAKPGHGVFLRPDKIEVGDFPEEDLFADDDEF